MKNLTVAATTVAGLVFSEQCFPVPAAGVYAHLALDPGLAYSLYRIHFDRHNFSANRTSVNSPSRHLGYRRQQHIRLKQLKQPRLGGRG